MRRSFFMLLAVLLLFPPLTSTAAPEQSEHPAPTAGSTIGIVVNTPAINIRRCPRADCASIGGVSLGDSLEITGAAENGFLPVKHGKDRGWAYGLFIASELTGTPALRQGPAGCNRIALIFSIGVGEPGAGLSWDVINVLEAESAPATMFVQAWWSAYYPAYVADFAQRGFSIGTQGVSDPDLSSQSVEDVMNTILDATAATDTALGGRGAADPLFAPASNQIDQTGLSLISFAGYLPVIWGIEPNDDSDSATADSVTRFVLDRAYDGAIVQLHLDAPNSAAVTAVALPDIIRGLRDDGYTLVSIPELALPCG